MLNEKLAELAQQQADLCRVFANPHRVLILWSLVESEKSVGEIASALELSMPSTSQHLRLMRARGILARRRAGQAIFYRLALNGCPAGCRLLIEAHRQRLSLPGDATQTEVFHEHRDP